MQASREREKWSQVSKTNIENFNDCLKFEMTLFSTMQDFELEDP